MRARANVVLPAPRSPESVTRSPGSSEFAMSTASRWVACSSGSATEKLDVPSVVRSIATAVPPAEPPSRRRLQRPVIEREDAGDGCTAAHCGFERHCSAVQLDEGTHQRKPQTGAAVPRAERMGLEPIEHLALHVGGNARSAVRHREYQGILEPLGGKRNGLARGRKAHGIGEEIEQRL